MPSITDACCNLSIWILVIPAFVMSVYSTTNTFTTTTTIFTNVGGGSLGSSSSQNACYDIGELRRDTNMLCCSADVSTVEKQMETVWKDWFGEEFPALDGTAKERLFIHPKGKQSTTKQPSYTTDSACRNAGYEWEDGYCWIASCQAAFYWTETEEKVYAYDYYGVDDTDKWINAQSDSTKTAESEKIELSWWIKPLYKSPQAIRKTDSRDIAVKFASQIIDGRN